ncbi:MAG: hypothetical protein E6I59_08090 [Chloroflexi bacterium]|nr:MAG: hypothetical protein E6I59_08090 [Chloroflexota bacterium]
MAQNYREERFMLEAEGAQLPAALTLPEGQEVKWSIVNVPCPVLIVQGGLDQSGVIADNGERLYLARHAARPDATAKAFFPDLQHFYKAAKPAMTSHESMMLDGETDERVSDAMSEWLEGLK